MEAWYIPLLTYVHRAVRWLYKIRLAPSHPHPLIFPAAGKKTGSIDVSAAIKYTTTEDDLTSRWFDLIGLLRLYLISLLFASSHACIH